MTTTKLPEGALSNDELKKLKESKKLTDKITLIKHLVTAPGTKYAVKLMFKASVIVGGVGLAYKVWNDSHIAEQREAGLFLSDVEAKKLVGSQREKY